MATGHLSRRATVCAAALLLTGGVALGQTHAPWPTDWNDWNDPALWATAGDPGNGADTTGYGAVDYKYRMGKFEVTAGQYTEFLNRVAGVDAYGLYNTSMWSSDYGCKIERFDGSGTGGDPYQYRVGADWANRPVNYVSWGDAARFANWLTNGQPAGSQALGTTESGSYFLDGGTSDAALLAVRRIAEADRISGKNYYFIPTEDEWYKAAYHKNDGATANYFAYPTSSDAMPSGDVVDSDPGNNANSMDTLGSPYHRTEVGEFEESDSPYGTFDQGGNVWEWNEAIIGSYRGERGGSFTNNVLEAEWRDHGYIPTYEYFHLAFRVVEVPEPVTLALLALGSLAMLRRRGRARYNRRNGQPAGRRARGRAGSSSRQHPGRTGLAGPIKDAEHVRHVASARARRRAGAGVPRGTAEVPPKTGGEGA